MITQHQNHGDADILGSREGKRAFIDVTMSFYKPIGRKLQLARLLDADVYVFFIKPDYTTHFLLKAVNERSLNIKTMILKAHPVP